MRWVRISRPCAACDRARRPGSGTRGAGRDPAPSQRDERPMGHRWCRSRPAVRVHAGRPGPEHELRLEMRYQLRRPQGALLGIEQHPAKLRGRESFPCHRERCEVPVRSARDSGCRLVRALVTRAAAQADRPVIIRAARDIHDVPMAIIALAREIGARMAIHAARGLENRQHPLEERCGCLGAIGCGPAIRVRLRRGPRRLRLPPSLSRAGGPCAQQRQHAGRCRDPRHAASSRSSSAHDELPVESVAAFGSAPFVDASAAAVWIALRMRS